MTELKNYFLYRNTYAEVVEVHSSTTQKNIIYYMEQFFGNIGKWLVPLCLQNQTCVQNTRRVTRSDWLPEIIAFSVVLLSP